MLEQLYSGVARWRRRAAERWPEQRRHLARPVISIGNLSVGGTGKTPVTAAVARWLLARGETPAILSRGYGRRDPAPGVVVVSDGRRVAADLMRAGDEPLLLARDVPGAIVCVADDRYLAGVVAERALGATVHVLDDGFQHLALARDIDVLVTAPGEITGGRVLPRGRLREPIASAARADVLVVVGASAPDAAREASALGIRTACGAHRRMGTPRLLVSTAGAAASAPGETAAPAPPPGSRVLVAAGIANPQRFADDVRGAGWTIAGEMWFADHHRFSRADLARIAARAGELGAAAVFVTEKDAVRLEPLGAPPVPLFALPMALDFDPPGLLFEQLAAVLGAGGGRRGMPSSLRAVSAEGCAR